jgi:hypothetical protein
LQLSLPKLPVQRAMQRPESQTFPVRQSESSTQLCRQSLPSLLQAKVPHEVVCAGWQMSWLQ